MDSVFCGQRPNAGTLNNTTHSSDLNYYHPNTALWHSSLAL
jgi:hypothetical protein